MQDTPNIGKLKKKKQSLTCQTTQGKEAWKEKDKEKKEQGQNQHQTSKVWTIMMPQVALAIVNSKLIHP